MATLAEMRGFPAMSVYHPPPMSGASLIDTTSPSRREAVALTTRLALGAGVWCATGAQVLAGRAPIGLREFLFLLAPLILVPLGADIVFASGGDETRGARFANLLLPVGGVLAAVSFWSPGGRGAVILAAAWVMTCAIASVVAVSHLRAGRAAARNRRSASTPTIEGACGVFAFVFLTVGAVWLLLSRAGARPFGYSAETVFLAALHFHFTGFILPATTSATAAALRVRGQMAASRLARTTARGVAAGILLGLPMIAAGNVTSAPVLRLAGAQLLAVSSLALAGLIVAVLPSIAPRPARMLLAVSALSLSAAMITAAIYAAGAYTGHAWLLVPEMTRTHGALNAIGFGFCGLTGWRLAQRRA